MTLSMTLTIVAICVLAEGFFSGSEIALVNVNRLAMSHKAQEGHFGARIVMGFLDNPEFLLGVTLLGTNMCTVTGAVTVTWFMINHFGETGELYAILCFWPVTFLLGEFIPKTVYQAKADRIAPVAAILLRVFVVVLYPLIWLFTRLSAVLVGALHKRGHHEPVVTRGDVRALARNREPSVDVDMEERRMIGRMIDFSSAKVSEVMVPLIDVIALEHTTRLGQAVEFVNEHTYSRYPVYRERVDQIIGVIDSYSLLNADQPEDPVRRVMHKPVFVPETMLLKTLLAELRHRGEPMAIVVDEYGGAVGIITLEDVLEEVLGDIEDEFDAPDSLYRKIGDKSYIFQARAEVDFINERFPFQLPEGEYETLGGFLLDRFDRIPKHKETLVEGRLSYTVLNPTDRTLTEVRVDILPEPQ